MRGEVTSRIYKDSKSASVRVSFAGSIESYQFAEDVQVRYDLTLAGPGVGPTPQMIIQATIGRDGQIKKADIGGPALIGAKQEDISQARQQLSDALKYTYLNAADGPFMQGSIVKTLRLADAVDDSDLKKIFENALVKGPGSAMRLVGRTLYQGRNSYVLALDGSEAITQASDSISFVTSGFAIIDERTGLYSQYKSLLQLSGSLSGESFSVEVLSDSAINY